MTTLRCSLRLFALSLFALTFSATAQAQTAQRTFVSTSGSDANTASLCSAANPCRGFAAAQTVTTAGGEIIALTSGGYGPVEITKAIQITAPTGVYVAITAQPGTAIGGTDAIRISAGSSDVVVLRGLTLNSLGVASGINVTSVGTLHVENCVVNGFIQNGINVDLTADSSRIFIKDTIVRNNGGSGIYITTSTGTVRASIDGSRAENNTYGFYAYPRLTRTQVTVSNSIASGNSDTGFFAFGFDDGVAEMSADSCVASNNGNGFRNVASAAGTSRMRVARSTATHNTTGINSFGGDFTIQVLAGTNMVAGNTVDKTGAIMAVGTDTNP